LEPGIFQLPDLTVTSGVRRVDKECAAVVGEPPLEVGIILVK